jgi:hypothetical protein
VTDKKKWYIVHVYSGFENKVKTALEERVATSPQKEMFGEVLVPTEEVVELVKGKRKTSSRKFYPGLHSGPDGTQRRDMAHCQQHGQGHRIPRRHVLSRRR